MRPSNDRIEERNDFCFERHEPIVDRSSAYVIARGTLKHNISKEVEPISSLNNIIMLRMLSQDLMDVSLHVLRLYEIS